MLEFLQSYYLYEDFLKLNHPDYFSCGLSVLDTRTLFATIHNEEDYFNNRRTLRLFCHNMKTCQTKSPFVLMKWLITTHRILPTIKIPYLLEDVLISLTALEQPITLYTFNNYFYQKLVKPYQQFLIKLTQFYLSSHHDQQYELITIYFSYNLLSFATHEFLLPALEFNSFLAKHYPCLYEYLHLLLASIKVLLYSKYILFKEVRIQIRNVYNNQFIITNEDIKILEENIVTLECSNQRAIIEVFIDNNFDIEDTLDALDYRVLDFLHSPQLYIRQL